MIKVTLGNNVTRKAVIVDETNPLRQTLEENGIDYARGTMHLDGSSLNPGDLNKTFAELGYDGAEGRDKCFLLNVVKADNAGDEDIA